MRTDLNVTNNFYLIIGGTTKAATTSLFNYLADHPQICATNIKETRFFLDANYPLPSKYRFEDGLHKYEEFYSYSKDKKIRLEATPDYLYSFNTPQKIKDSLPKTKFIFILREPVSRLISWYKYAKQIGKLPGEVTFDEYVQFQFKNDADSDSEQRVSHPSQFALKQGRYSLYLKSFLKVFNRDQIFIVFYEDFSKNPMLNLKSICTFADIDPEFYMNYDFKIFNRSDIMKSLKLHQFYVKFRIHARNYTYNKPVIHKILRKIRFTFEPIYLKFNAKSSEQLSMSKATMKLLHDYYCHEADNLTDLLGTRPPWK